MHSIALLAFVSEDFIAIIDNGSTTFICIINLANSLSKSSSGTFFFLNSSIKVPADTVDGLVAEVESLNSKLSTLTLKYLELTAELEQTTAQVASLKQTIKSLKQQNGQTKETEDRGDNVNDR